MHVRTDNNDVAEKIEKIISVFLETQLHCATSLPNADLALYLQKKDPEFRSIAYESASMAIAIRDLETGKTLDKWLYFARNPGKIHMAQVCVGLGWAIAKLGLDFLPVVKKINTMHYHRIADGCGYYDGSFRKKKTVLNQQVPGYIPGAAHAWYDQGVGRSLWYTGKGDVRVLINRIAAFPANRQPDLWRGAGTAIAYVGGSEERTLRLLFDKAASNSRQLAMGAALAAKSRADAGIVNIDTDNCARLWFQMLSEGESDTLPGSISYQQWVVRTESRLAEAFGKAI